MMLHGLSERFRMPGKGIVFAGPRDFVGSDRLRHAHARSNSVWNAGFRYGYTTFGAAGLRSGFCFLTSRTRSTSNTAISRAPAPFASVFGPAFIFAITMRRSIPKSRTEYVLNAVDYRLEISGGPDLPVLRMKTTPQTGFTYDPKIVGHRLSVRETPRLSIAGISVESRLLSSLILSPVRRSF